MPINLWPKATWTFQRLGLFLFCWSMFSPLAFAQIQNQPAEVIVSTPISSFSDRSGLWPSTEIFDDKVLLDRRSLSEALNAVPGLQARELGSPSLSIRGSAQADRVLQLFEGVPLNLADGVGASELFIPREVLGSFQLFKGPASVFYGAAAMAGAIDHRLRIYDSPGVRVSGLDDQGALGARSALVVLPIHNDEGGAQLSVFHEFNPGHYPFQSVTQEISGRRENNSKEITRVVAYGDYEFDNVEVKSRVIMSRTQTESPGSLTYPSHSVAQFDGLLTSMDGLYRISETSQMGIAFSDLRTWGSFRENGADAGSSATARTALSADYTSQVTDTIIIHNFIDMRNDSFTASYVDGARFFDLSFEIGQSFEYALTPAISLQPAYRYLPDLGLFFPAIGIIHNNEDQRLWLTFSEGFRSPSIANKFSNTTYYVGNPSLKPERSRSFEVGFLKEPGHRFLGHLSGLSYGGSIFYIDYDSLLTSIPAGGSASTLINEKAARAYGLETTVGWIHSTWRITASYNYLDARTQDTGEYLRLSPQHQAVLTVSQRLGSVLISLQDTYWSSTTDLDPASGKVRDLPGWNTLDLTLRTLGLSDWELQAGILNILDVPRELTIGYPEPQRRVFASALRNF